MRTACSVLLTQWQEEREQAANVELHIASKCPIGLDQRQEATTPTHT